MESQSKAPNFKFLVLDLEMNQPSGEIIQVGAVAGNLETGKIHEMFNRYIRIHEPVNDKEPNNIVKLTKITDQVLASKGVSLDQAVKDLKEFMIKNEVNSCPASWGEDAQYLLTQMDNRGIKLEGLFGYDAEFNIKKIYQVYRLRQGKSMQGGVSSACKKLGRPFVGQKHNALDDAKNTFIIWHELYKRIKQD